MEALIDHLTVGPLQTNCFVLGCPETKKSVIIDCGSNAKGLYQLATQSGYTLQDVWLTHAHIDHVGGLEKLEELHGGNLSISMHPSDKTIYMAAKAMGAMYGYPIHQLPEISKDLSDGDEVRVGNLIGSVHHFPGHSPGCVVFYFDELKVAFSGDLLFKDSIGRMDLPGGSTQEMRKSLNKLKTAFPDETQILCGHGPMTTLGREKRYNPYLTQRW